MLWWRSVGHSHNAFVLESLVDELAKAAGKDPLEYRRALLKAHPRHLGALNLAAEKAGWGTPAATGRARGIAVHESFGSYVAQVAEVSVEKNGSRCTGGLAPSLWGGSESRERAGPAESESPSASALRSTAR